MIVVVLANFLLKIYILILILGPFLNYILDSC